MTSLESLIPFMFLMLWLQFAGSLFCLASLVMAAYKNRNVKRVLYLVKDNSSRKAAPNWASIKQNKLLSACFMLLERYSGHPNRWELFDDMIELDSIAQKVNQFVIRTSMQTGLLITFAALIVSIKPLGAGSQDIQIVVKGLTIGLGSTVGGIAICLLAQFTWSLRSSVNHRRSSMIIELLTIYELDALKSENADVQAELQKEKSTNEPNPQLNKQPNNTRSKQKDEYFNQSPAQAQ